MKIKSAMFSAVLLFLLPIASFANGMGDVVKIVNAGSYQIKLTNGIPAQSLTIKDFSGGDRQINIAGARDISSNGKVFAVTGDSGTYLIDMNGNIILGILEKGTLVALDDYIAVSDNHSLVIFNKNGIMVCQRMLPGFATKSISIKGTACKAVGSYQNGVVAERNFTITEEDLVETQNK